MNYNMLLTALQNLIGYKPSQVELRRILNLKQGTMHNRSVRNSNFSNEELKKISEYYNVDLFYGVQLSDEDNKPKIKADYYYDVFGSCGSGAFVLSESKRPIDIPVETIHNFSKFNNYSVINAVGDSMLPNIHNKDLLIVEHTTEIKDNQIYVFCYNDTIYVKRLVKNINKLIIISDNPNKEIYENIILEKDEINNLIIIGQIVGLMRQCK